MPYGATLVQHHVVRLDSSHHLSVIPGIVLIPKLIDACHSIARSFGMVIHPVTEQDDSCSFDALRTLLDQQILCGRQMHRNGAPDQLTMSTVAFVGNGPTSSAWGILLMESSRQISSTGWDFQK